jgi:hypothetical protein
VQVALALCCDLRGTRKLGSTKLRKPCML